jgi:hypothetical protein
MVRVDEAGHDDAAACVDHVGIAGGQIGADRLNPVAVDQHVGAREVSDLRVHRHDGAAADEIAPAGTAGVRRRRILRGCRARAEQIDPRRGEAGRRRAFEKVAPRGGVFLRPAAIAQDAHVVASLVSHSER